MAVTAISFMLECIKSAYLGLEIHLEVDNGLYHLSRFPDNPEVYTMTREFKLRK